MLFSKCAVCDSETLQFSKQQEASGLLSSLTIKTHSSKIPLILLRSFFVLIVLNKSI